MSDLSQKIEQHRTIARKKLLIAVLSMTLGNVARACKRAGIHRDTYYDWRNKDPEFSLAVKTAGQESLKYFVAQAKNDEGGF